MAMPAAAVTACCSAMPTSKKRSGKRSSNGSRPVESGHGRGDGDELGSCLGLLDDRLGEGLRVAGRHRLRRPDCRVEHRRVVEVLLVVVLGRRVAPALLGEHVDDDRARRTRRRCAAPSRAPRCRGRRTGRCSARRASRRTPAARSISRIAALSGLEALLEAACADDRHARARTVSSRALAAHVDAG